MTVSHSEAEIVEPAPEVVVVAGIPTAAGARQLLEGLRWASLAA